MRASGLTVSTLKSGGFPGPDPRGRFPTDIIERKFAVGDLFRRCGVRAIFDGHGDGRFEPVERLIAMMHRSLRKTAAALSLAAMALSVAGSALAQPLPPPPPPGADQYPPPPGGDPYAPPGGGSYNMPPPPGYQPGDNRDDASPQARDEDQRYSYAAEQWAAQNCVAQRAENSTTGAVIGGLLGALVGGGLAGRRDRGVGIVAGGAVGAVTGSAIGGSQANNPNCPPGYGLRPGAVAFYPGAVYGPAVVYAAPTWYDPWLWYGNHWIYRPYPYHRYWYRTHR